VVCCGAVGDSRSRTHDSHVAGEVIFMWSRHQLADELYREQLAQAEARRRPAREDARRVDARRPVRLVLQLAAAARGLIVPRTQAGS
jgi:hypothetical protein